MANRPVPAKLRVLRGNPGKRPIPDEPIPPDGEISPPGWLDAVAQKHWNELAPTLLGMQVLTTADVAALALLADAMAEYVACRRNGKISQAQDARKFVKGMLIEFGMTPSSRSRIKAQKPKDEGEDRWEGLL